MKAVEAHATPPASDLQELSRRISAELRSRVLALVPAEIGLDSACEEHSVWGVVIETAHLDAVASLVVLADGSVSLYVSDGAGCVGCGSDREIRAIGAELLVASQSTASLAIKTNDVEYPAPGAVRFYFLTRDGLHSTQVRLEELRGVDAELNKLYFAGQKVMSAIERLGAGQSLQREIRMALAGTTLEPANGESSCLSVGSAARRLRT